MAIVTGEWNYGNTTPLLPKFALNHKDTGGHGLLSTTVEDLQLGDLLDYDAAQQLTNMMSQWVGCWADMWLSATPATDGIIPIGMSICAQDGQNFNPNGGNVHHLPFGKHSKWTNTWKAMPVAYLTLRAWAATSPDRPSWTLQVDQPGYGEIKVTKKRYQ